MKQQPDGFAISFNRYDRNKRWGWKQTKDLETSTLAGHVLRRDGLRSRRAALNDLLGEIDRREQLEKRVAAAAPLQATATTG